MSAVANELILSNSIGPIRLGATRSEILNLLGEPDYSSNEGIYGLEEFHDKDNFRVQYENETHLCYNIGIYRPAELWFQGVNVLALDWDDALTWIRGMDPSCELKDENHPPGCTSYRLQLSISAEDSGEGLVLNSLTIFSPNYWEKSEDEKEAWIQRKMAEILST
jgi:hypothetical protein